MSRTEIAVWAAAIVPLIHLLGVFNAAHAIMHARTSQGSAAWAIALISFPYLAIPLYWIFGSSRFSEYSARMRQVDHEYFTSIEGLLRQAAKHRVWVSEGGPGFQRLVEHLGGWPVTGGNQVTLLPNGDAAFPAIFKAIAEAREYVLVEFFIVRDDQLGRELKERLKAKAREGVKVYLMCDAIGSGALPPAYLQELRESGADCRLFSTNRGFFNRLRLNFRNHRKIVVTDGKRAFVGGLNVGDEYMGRDPRFGKWRDTHLMIAGPAVARIQAVFAADWYWTAHQLPEVGWPDEPGSGKAAVLPLPSGPQDELEAFRLFLGEALHQAKQRIWIASPYFVPDEGTLQALQAAALRGVDVRILLPLKPDHLMVYMASFSYFDELIPHGVKIFRYRPGFLHQKVVLVDQWLASVGTANLDNRSFRLNFEISILVFEPGFCAAVEAMLEADFSQSTKQKGDEYRSRNLLFRTAVRACRLASPIL